MRVIDIEMEEFYCSYLKDVSVPSRGMRVIDMRNQEVLQWLRLRFRPLSGNEGYRLKCRVTYTPVARSFRPLSGNEGYRSEICKLYWTDIQTVSVPSRGMRVID